MMGPSHFPGLVPRTQLRTPPPPRQRHGGISPVSCHLAWGGCLVVFWRSRVFFRGRQKKGGIPRHEIWDDGYTRHGGAVSFFFSSLVEERIPNATQLPENRRGAFGQGVRRFTERCNVLDICCVL